MFDSHRHLSQNKDPHENALYATSRPDEWPNVLCSSGEAVIGIGCLPPCTLPEIESVSALLKSHPELQVAEVGLDRRYPNIDQQTIFLLEMLHLGFQLGRSVSLHCVREDGLLLSILRGEKKSLPTVLWHGCTASIETVKEAVRLGVIPSYGPSFFGSRLASHPKNIIALPFSLETDFTGEEKDYHSILSGHLTAFSSWSGLSEDYLENNNDEIRAILTHDTPAR